MNYNFHVYCLVCPIDKNIKYIGMTQNIKHRLDCHFYSPLKCTKKWILNLKEKGLKPILKILQSFESNCYLDRNFALASEFIWINEFKNNGIFNVSVPKIENIYPTFLKKVEIETNDKINAYYESLKLAK